MEAVGEHFNKMYFWLLCCFGPFLRLLIYRSHNFFDIFVHKAILDCEMSISTLLNVTKNNLFYKSNLVLSEIFQDLCPNFTLL